MNPGRPIERSASLVNRLTDEMVRDAPPMGQIVPALRKTLTDRILVGYNASFDAGFLRREFRLAGEEFPAFRVVDVMALAKRMLPGLGRYPLVHVVKALGVRSTSLHRAMAGVEATSAIFHRFLSDVALQGVITVEELERITRSSSPIAESLRRDKIKLLNKAIAEGRRVHLFYRPRDQVLSVRDVTPLKLRTFAGHVQLIGFCHLRQAELTFTIDSVQDIHIIEG